jgi:predicted MPP superfamily phosphohydrolase
MGKHYETGLFEQNGRKLYVNRGIGTLAPHVRINCRPEITVFELS